MKKAIALVLATLMLGASASAITIDWASLTFDEVVQIVAAGEAELDKRGGLYGGYADSDDSEHTQPEWPKYIFQNEEINVYFTGNYYDDTNYDYGIEAGFLNLETMIENNSDENIIVGAEDVSINGYMVFAQWQYSFISSVQAGKSAKINMLAFLSNAGISNFSEVNEMEMRVRITDENYHTLYSTDTLTFTFNH